MYNIIIWLALFVNGVDEVLPIYNPNISFKNKESCEQFIITNYSAISLDIQRQFQLQEQIKLKEIVNMECVNINNKI